MHPFAPFRRVPQIPHFSAAATQRAPEVGPAAGLLRQQSTASEEPAASIATSRRRLFPLTASRNTTRARQFLSGQPDEFSENVEALRTSYRPNRAPQTCRAQIGLVPGKDRRTCGKCPATDGRKLPSSGLSAPPRPGSTALSARAKTLRLCRPHRLSRAKPGYSWDTEA